MASTKKKNTSHTWRAILAGRIVLQMGCVRRIGDARTINIGRDQWLPGKVGLKLVCRMEGATAEHVSDLLNPDERSWGEEALDHNLVPLDAAAARRIPLGRPSLDTWAWTGEHHNLYTVKPGYMLHALDEAQQCSFVQGRENHSNHIKDPLWQRLWKCKVPPKIHVFWWCILNEYIPSRANLHRRHIDPLSTCDTCGACDETTFHALLECTYARQFWIRLCEITDVKLPTLTPDSWSSDILEDRTCNGKDRAIILCGMWSLWRWPTAWQSPYWHACSNQLCNGCVLHLDFSKMRMQVNAGADDCSSLAASTHEHDENQCRWGLQKHKKVQGPSGQWLGTLTIIFSWLHQWRSYVLVTVSGENGDSLQN